MNDIENILTIKIKVNLIRCGSNHFYYKDIQVEWIMSGIFD